MSNKTKKRLAGEETAYSAEVPGEDRNYNWPARFDVNGEGFLGITQYDERGRVTDRVLLSPAQVAAMDAFRAEHLGVSCG